MPLLKSALMRYRAAVARQRAAGYRWSVLAALRQSVGWRLRHAEVELPLPLQAFLLRAAITAGLDTARRRERLAHVLLRKGRRDLASEQWLRAIERGSRSLEVHDLARAPLLARGAWEDERTLMFRRIELQEQLAREQGLDPEGLRYAGREFVEHIGCLTMLDVVAKQHILAAGGPETVLIAAPHWVSNAAYLDCFRPHFAVIEDPVEIEKLGDRAKLLKLHPHSWRGPDGRLLPHLDASSEVEKRWRDAGRGPLLRVRDEVVARGRERLDKLGITPDDWFVALHVREDDYDVTRNAGLATYERAIETVIEGGGWVVRLGRPPVRPLPRGERVIDYSNSDMCSDEMDVFLLSQARFMIGTQSGPTAVAGTFGVPAVATNQLLHCRNWFSNHIYLPKLYRRNRDGAPLTLEHALSLPAAYVQNPAVVASFGVVAVDNTSEEIDAAVVEMLEVLESGPRYTPQDDRLQERFLASTPASTYRLPPGGSRVAREFLRRHEDLLSDL